MKNLLLIALLLLPFYGISQTKKPIDSFLGIKLGSTTAQAKAALQARGAIFDKTESKPEMLVYKNVSLGSRKAEYLIFATINDRVYRAFFIFKPQLRAKTIEYYDNLVSSIEDVYGEGEATLEFKSPYEDGDGHELSAIEGGYADYSTLWISENENSIEAKISTGMMVILEYQDSKLMDIAIEKKKQKEKADF